MYFLLQMEGIRILFFLLTWSLLFPLRQPNWVLLLRNPDDHQTSSIPQRIGFHVTSMLLFHLIFYMLTSDHFYFGDLV